MTDNEIKKALECCDGSFDKCGECPLDSVNQDKLRCWELEKSALDLINRLQADKQILEIELKAMRGAANSYKAEVERLEANNKTLENVVKNTFIKKAGFDIDPLVEIKAEAYKEFAEKLKNKYKPYVILGSEVAEIEIDNLLKELAGENNETKTF